MVAIPPLNPAGIGRRGLLLGGAGIAAAGLVGCGRDEPDLGSPIAFPRAVERIRYADDHPDQHGFLGVPVDGEETAKALVVLIHGGYWFRGFGANLIAEAATDLRTEGFVTWNVEYRRTGGGGGGYPSTFTDIANAIDYIPRLPLKREYPVALVGHSAGGHLAVWAASRTAQTPGGPSAVKITHAYALSAVLDLEEAEQKQLGNGAAALLMGGPARQFPRRYDLGDPIRLVPASCAVSAIHAADDTIVPTSQSRSYVQANRAAGGEATFQEVAVDHLDMVRPDSASWKAVRQGLTDQFG